MTSPQNPDRQQKPDRPADPDPIDPAAPSLPETEPPSSAEGTAPRVSGWDEPGAESQPARADHTDPVGDGYWKSGTGYPDAPAATDFSSGADPAARNGFAPWALGLGIASVVMVVTFLVAPLAVVPGIIGIVLGILALRRVRACRPEVARKGMSITGLVLSIIGTLLGIVFAVGLFVLGSAIVDEVGPIVEECEASTNSEAELQRCLESRFTEEFQTPAE